MQKNVAGRNVTSEIRLKLAFPTNVDIRLSPDGTKVVYASFSDTPPGGGSNWGVRIADVRGTYDRHLNIGGFSYPFISSWSRDSRYIFLRVTAEDDKPVKNGLYAIRVDSTNAKPYRILRHLQKGNPPEYVSPDGNIILWVKDEIRPKKKKLIPWIYSTPANTKKPIPEKLHIGFWPQWSPNGKLIVFINTISPDEYPLRTSGEANVSSSTRKGSSITSVWVMNRNGSNSKRVLSSSRIGAYTGYNEDIRRIAWLDDDTLLVVATHAKAHDTTGKQLRGYESTQDLWVVNIKGGVKQVIEGVEVMDVTPNGKILLVRLRKDGEEDFRVLRLGK